MESDVNEGAPGGIFEFASGNRAWVERVGRWDQ